MKLILKTFHCVEKKSINYTKSHGFERLSRILFCSHIWIEGLFDYISKKILFFMVKFFYLLWPKGLEDLFVLPKLRTGSPGTDLFSFDLVFDLVFMGALEKLAEIPGI